MTLHGLDLGSEEIARYCRSWGIRRLCVFGSILGNRFRPDSDVDLLFELEDESSLTLFRWQDMEDDLAEILGRNVDLVHRRSVETTDNPYRKHEILDSAKVVYDSRSVLAA